MNPRYQVPMADSETSVVGGSEVKKVKVHYVGTDEYFFGEVVQGNSDGTYKIKPSAIIVKKVDFDKMPPPKSWVEKKIRQLFRDV